MVGGGSVHVVNNSGKESGIERERQSAKAHESA